MQIKLGVPLLIPTVFATIYHLIDAFLQFVASDAYNLNVAVDNDVGSPRVARVTGCVWLGFHAALDAESVVTVLTVGLSLLTLPHRV